MSKITVVIDGATEVLQIGMKLAGGKVVALSEGGVSIDHEQPKLMTMGEFATMLKRTRSGVDKLRARDKTFPKPMKDGTDKRSRIYFVREEIDAWLKSYAR